MNVINESSPNKHIKNESSDSACRQVDSVVSKPPWLVEPIADDKVWHGCLNCGGTEHVLDMETRLYNGFGGWMITRDNELYFQDSNMDRDWET